MRGDHANVVHSAVLHRDVGIKAPGNGLIDNKLFLLIQQSYLTFLELDKTVYLRAFGIEKAHYGILLLAGRKKNIKLTHVVIIRIPLTNPDTI